MRSRQWFNRFRAAWLFGVFGFISAITLSVPAVIIYFAGGENIGMALFAIAAIGGIISVVVAGVSKIATGILGTGDVGVHCYN